jgi:hypothetical protein
MKNDAFISELHDIGKLVDKDAVEKSGIKISGQTFGDFDFTQKGFTTTDQPSSPSWYLQYEDNKKNGFNQDINSQEFLPTTDSQIRANFLLTKIADGISASITRTKTPKWQAGQGVYTLWNPNKKIAENWAAFTDLSSLKGMFKYIDSCQNHQQFFEDFKEKLVHTPEEKNAPGNIVSLYTHLELSGKIFRILKRHSRSDVQNQSNVLVYNNQPIKSMCEACGDRYGNKAIGKWIFRLVFARFIFSQSLIRLHDLNIFKIRTEMIRDFSSAEATKDYVLFFTDDFMCLFTPRDEELPIQELLKPFTDKGLIIDYTELEAESNLLTSSYEKAYREFHIQQPNRYLKVYEKRLNAQLQPEIGPNICDSCQIREGKIRIKEQTQECLCDTCQEIRDMGERASEYAKWEGKAAWIKITLDQDRLKEMLLELFDEYLAKSPLMNNVASNDKTELKNSFRPLAVQMDFIKDYKKLLNDFKEKIYTIKDDEENPCFSKEAFLYPIDGYKEFGIFKAPSGKSILAVINTFTYCLEQIFPKCLTIDNSPIRLAINIAPVKYPYQEHWRFLSEPKGTIDIQSPSERLTLSTQQYRDLNGKIGKANIALSHFLHRLTGIKTTTKSNKMVMLEVYDRDNRNKFSAILELLEEGLTPEQILAFYNLAQEEQA